MFRNYKKKTALKTVLFLNLLLVENIYLHNKIIFKHTLESTNIEKNYENQKLKNFMNDYIERFYIN